MNRRIVQVNDLPSSALPSGATIPWPTHIAPSGFLLSYGQAVSRAKYPKMFANIVPKIGTFTVTIATPGVISLTAHGLSIGDSFYATTTGALPTSFTANTLYYIISAGFTANSFRFSTTYEGTAVNTSGSQSGIHTLFYCPWGLGDGSTTFNTPDYRGRTPLGKDNLGGIAAGRITATKGSVIGQNGGEENHTLATSEIPAHTHSQDARTYLDDNTGTTRFTNVSGSPVNPQEVRGGTTASTGDGGSHNNMSPYNTCGWIIKI